LRLSVVLEPQSRVKTFGIVMSAVAVAAGIIVGRLQYEQERLHAAAPSEPAPLPAAASTAAGAKTAPPARASAAPARRTGYVPAAEDIVGGEGGGAARDARETGPRPGGRDAAPAAGAANEAADGRLEEIAASIREEEFDKALRLAEEVLDPERRSSPALQAAAVRLQAKARVFESLYSSMPKPQAGAGGGGKMEEVLLANRNKLLASKVEKELDCYVIHLANGAVYRPPVEEVLEIRSVDGSAHEEAQRKDLEARTAKLTSAIDLYVLGVQECYGRGLKKEAMALMERLLTLPDSDQIPLLFIAEGGESALADWRIAAGRARAEETAAAPRASEPSAPPTASPAEALVQVSRLLGEAQALYQTAATREGRERELAEARKRLNRAMELLEPLPPDDTVKKLRRELSQLLSDIVRVSPF
jgi:tetratricopeptide (TPR) repeat protein